MTKTNAVKYVLMEIYLFFLLTAAIASGGYAYGTPGDDSGWSLVCGVTSMLFIMNMRWDARKNYD